MNIPPITYVAQFNDLKNPQKRSENLVKLYSAGYPIDAIAKVLDCSVDNIVNTIEEQINAKAIKENRKAIRDEILQKYTQGQSPRQIGCSESLIQDILKEKMNENAKRIKDVNQIKRSGIVSAEQEDEIKNLHKEGNTIGEIAQYYSCNPAYIAMVIRKKDQ